MVIIKFHSKTNLSEVLHNGSQVDCLILYDKITYDSEKIGHMMVNELNIDPYKVTKVREFASSEFGHIFDLIICGDIATRCSPLL